MANTQKYTVGWICVLPTEAVAAATFLDAEHDDVPEVALHDNNAYTLGNIGEHNVVIAVLPDAEYGLVSAATVARDMLHSFPNIRISVMVGTGGGAPSLKHDIRLGDVVVSSRGGGKGGVVQYDYGKAVQGLPFEHTDFLDQPPMALRTAVTTLKGLHERKGHHLHVHVEKKLAENPRLRRKYSRPPLDTDTLYRTDFIHPNPSQACTSTCGDEPGRLVSRAERIEGEDEPLIHYGLIASGNQLVKDAAMRDRLASQMDVLCFEMEAAGLMNHWPCLVIRGICDYSDSHKNKQWQGFAAMMAAAYAKDLLCRILPKKVEAEDRISDSLKKFQDVLVETKRAVDETHRVVSTMGCNQLSVRITKWLSPASMSINITSARAHRHPGTGEWFLKSKIFQQWESKRLPHLWLHGLPGCGKTVLSVTILDYLSRKKPQSRLIKFFFDFSDSTKRNLESLLRTLAFQLRRGKAMPELVSLFEAHEEGLKRPSISTLEGYIRSMVLAYGHVIIILDALDECTSRQDVLGWMDRMVSSLGSDHVQFLVTGRPETDLEWGISRAFGERGCLRLDNEAVDADIASFVAAKLESRPEFVRKNLSPDLKDQIRQSLGNEADGMFRWAACQLDTLVECLNPFAIRKALTQLPRTLDETYQRMIDKIPHEHESDAVRLLQFLVHARAPLNTSEVMDILAIQTEGDQWRFNLECKPFLQECITQYCPGLIAITEKKVRLAHFSVKEFLLQQSQFSTSLSNVTITLHCLTYLTDVGGAAISYDEMSPLGYHATSWMEYAILAGETQILLREILRFLGNEAAFLPWLAKYQILKYSELGTRGGSPGGSQLYSTCFGGLLSVFRVLLNDGADVNSRGGVFDNALQAASYGGHLEMVRHLLDKGAEMFEFSGHCGSALEAASRQGHHEIVRILLEHGANPDSQDSFSASAIHMASRRNHLEVVRLLLKYGANVDGCNERGSSALHGAALEGNQDMAQLLLDNGADHRLQPDILTLVTSIIAAYPNDDAMAETMVNFELYSLQLSGSLYYGSGITEFGKFNDDDPAACKGNTALHVAAEKGHPGTVQLLLDYGADPNINGGPFGSPLQAAISNGHEEIAQLLRKYQVESVKAQSTCVMS